MNGCTSVEHPVTTVLDAGNGEKDDDRYGAGHGDWGAEAGLWRVWGAHPAGTPLPGVQEVEASAHTQLVTVVIDPGRASPDQVLAKLGQLG